MYYAIYHANLFAQSAEAVEYTDCTSAKSFLDMTLNNHIYPTPPLGQDMTQGQFF